MKYFCVSYLVDKLRFLVCGSKFKELLDDVVTKDVGHETVGGREDLLEDQLLLRWSCSLQLLLDESGPVLVLAKLHNMVRDLPQLEVGKPIVPGINYFIG